MIPTVRPASELAVGCTLEYQVPTRAGDEFARSNRLGRQSNSVFSVLYAFATLDCSTRAASTTSSSNRSDRYSDRLRRCLLPLSPRLIGLEADLRSERSGTVDTPDHGLNLKARGRSRFFELHPGRVRDFARLSTGTDHESVHAAFGIAAGAFVQRVRSRSHLSATDLGRQPSVMPCRSQWSARPLSLVLIVSSPFRTVVDSLFVNNESTVFTDSFDRVGSDPAIALRTWVRAGVCLDVLVEACFVDISSPCFLTNYRDSPIRRTPHPLRGK